MPVTLTSEGQAVINKTPKRREDTAQLAQNGPLVNHFPRAGLPHSMTVAAIDPFCWQQPAFSKRSQWNGGAVEYVKPSTSTLECAEYKCAAVTKLTPNALLPVLEFKREKLDEELSRLQCSLDDASGYRWDNR